MDRLWAPWRIKYITAKKSKGCLFCAARKAAPRHYVFYKSRYSLAMLNIFPYNNGHVMIAPLRHKAHLEGLSEAEVLDLFKVLKKTKRLIDKAVKPQGYNIGINLGSVAGAGIPGHLHIHIVPRWPGDTNFMPVLGSTKIISQSLDELYKRLRNEK